MKKTVFALAASAAALAIPAAAHAQQAEPFIGVSGGYHDLSVEGEVEDEFPGVEINDGSAIVGGFAGVDFLAGGNFFIGAEANFHIGTDAVDSEYGASARIGIRDAGGAKYYLRGGYQEVNLDFANIIEIPGVEVTDDDFVGIDDTAGDYLVGAGAEFPLGETTFLRVNVDTIGFDSARATAGFGLRF
ncbi:outer membrane beta-barrel protein [Aurantiacibacter sediminis]|uniref:Outer membrane beta-barrel protein n=1 Tax=Aurantiacibacter sediminis TaxID=2793064 RepID=A0ABS0N3J0_9SPHN|nr:outer membrane beta-barrel protein [Aurantiacibacter sediminis]MBH5322538.1 outer membrane beta-barrel protein [Aurantiacibacter sediminis]